MLNRALLHKNMLERNINLKFTDTNINESISFICRVSSLKNLKLRIFYNIENA